MRNLLKLFLKYYAVFLFLLLEFVAFLMLFQQNNYHNALFLNSASGVMGFVNTQTAHVSDYFSLKKENDLLQKENLSLRKKLERKTAVSEGYESSYIDAIVINNSVIRQKNFITINRGEMHGLKKQMGVLGHQGVIGVVENISGHFASVIPIININFHLSAQLKKNSFYGALGWDGQDSQFAQLHEIPNYVDVQKGDTIITSGFSYSFDEGQLIGTVYSAEKSSASAFWIIQVKLATDFRNINHIYVIDRAKVEEQKSLEELHD
ncbi:MAG: rod shape-determining protein MreC [Bacteroidota bacterium]|nr:rod shape-determining protein MreC [Bacteroidota bacterium]